MPKSPTERNEELLQQVAKKAGVTTEKVMEAVPAPIKLVYGLFPKVLGGYLKKVLENIPEGEGISQNIDLQQTALAAQISKDWNSNKDKYMPFINKIPGAIRSVSDALGVDLSNPEVSGYNAAKQSLDADVLAKTILNCPKIPTDNEVAAIRAEVISEVGDDPSALLGGDADADASAAAGHH